MEITAQSIVLKDSEGVEKIILSAGEARGRSHIWLRGASKSSLSITASGDEQPRMVFKNQNGRDCLLVNLDEDGRPKIVIYNDNGSHAFQLRFSEDAGVYEVIVSKPAAG